MIVVLFLTALVQAQVSPLARQIGYSYLDGKVFTSTVTRDDMVSSPRWTVEDEAPPLAAGAAARAAIAMFRKVLPNEDLGHWHITAVALEQVSAPDVWVYEVKFGRDSPCQMHPPTGGGGCGSSGDPGTMTVEVLMDGRAVRPVVTPKTVSHPSH